MGHWPNGQQGNRGRDFDNFPGGGGKQQSKTVFSICKSWIHLIQEHYLWIMAVVKAVA